MDVVVDQCAGLDVHKKTVVACVCVPGESGERSSEVRTFCTYTADLEALRPWEEPPERCRPPRGASHEMGRWSVGS